MELGVAGAAVELRRRLEAKANAHLYPVSVTFGGVGPGRVLTACDDRKRKSRGTKHDVQSKKNCLCVGQRMPFWTA